MSYPLEEEVFDNAVPLLEERSRKKRRVVCTGLLLKRSDRGS